MPNRYYPGEEDLAFWQGVLDEPHFVYVLRAVGDAAIKVGRAKDPEARRRTLQTAHPRPLRLLYVLPGGAALERHLQACARQGNTQLGGGDEWFVGPLVDQFLLLVEQLSRRMVKDYDGSGSPPEPPVFGTEDFERPPPRPRGIGSSHSLSTRWRTKPDEPAPVTIRFVDPSTL
jgi:hypothetical protein